eukprot:UN4598
MFLMGAPAGGKSPQGAAGGPPQAIGSIDANGGALGGGFGAVNPPLGRGIGFFPKKKVLEFFNPFAGGGSPGVPPNIFPFWKALDGNPPPQAFFPFKGVVVFFPGGGGGFSPLGRFGPPPFFF